MRSLSAHHAGSRVTAANHGCEIRSANKQAYVRYIGTNGHKP